jgi:hypothetical protein
MDLSVIKTGDLLHCQGSGFIPRAISFFTGSKITHTAVAIHIWGQLYVIDAQKPGVFPRPFGTWMAEYGYKFEVQRNPFCMEEKPFAMRAMSKSGSKYDLKLLLLEHPSEIAKDEVGIKSDVNSKFERNDKYVCSEFATWCHMIPESYKFTPKMVKEYCDANNWKTIMKNY